MSEEDFNFGNWIVDDAIDDACKQYVSCLRCNTIIYAPNGGGGISIKQVGVCPNCGNSSIGFIYSEREWPEDDFKPDACKETSLEETLEELEVPSPIKLLFPGLFMPFRYTPLVDAAKLAKKINSGQLLKYEDLTEEVNAYVSSWPYGGKPKKKLKRTAKKTKKTKSKPKTKKSKSKPESESPIEIKIVEI